MREDRRTPRPETRALADGSVDTAFRSRAPARSSCTGRLHGAAPRSARTPDTVGVPVRRMGRDPQPRPAEEAP